MSLAHIAPVLGLRSQSSITETLESTVNHAAERIDLLARPELLLETLDSEINFNSEATESQPAGDELS